MSTLSAILMWILVSVGAMDYDCYVQQLSETSEVQPTPPPSETSSDGQCSTLDTERRTPRHNISNGI